MAPKQPTSDTRIEEARQELLEHAGVVCYDEYGVAALLELADAYALAVLDAADAEMLPIARQINDGFLPQVWKKRSQRLRLLILGLSNGS